MQDAVFIDPKVFLGLAETIEACIEWANTRKSYGDFEYRANSCQTLRDVEVLITDADLEALAGSCPSHEALRKRLFELLPLTRSKGAELCGYNVIPVVARLAVKMMKHGRLPAMNQVAAPFLLSHERVELTDENLRSFWLTRLQPGILAMHPGEAGKLQHGRWHAAEQSSLACRLLAQMISSCDGPTAEPPPAVPNAPAEEKQPRYKFKLEGAMWHVVFGEEKGYFPKHGGFANIAKLLQSPETSIDGLSFRETDPTPQNTEHTNQPILDSTAEAEFRRRLIENKEELDQAERNHDEASKERLVDERDKIQLELQQSQALGGRSRMLNRPHPAVCASKRVAQAIRRAKDELIKPGSSMLKLKEYLDRSIKRDGVQFTYRPESSLRWEL